MTIFVSKYMYIIDTIFFDSELSFVYKMSCKKVRIHFLLIKEYHYNELFKVLHCLIFSSSI